MNREKRVLLVDDEASIRRQLSIGLIQRGFDVEDCEDGVSALHKIESARQNGIPHNYVILDLRLPDINGMKILEVIKSKYPDLPVIVITGYGDEQVRDLVKQEPMSSYLDKPFQLEELEAELKRLSPQSSTAVPKVKTEEEFKPLESAYIFIRGKNDLFLENIFNQLYFADPVLYCDAVRGDWDIVLLVQSGTRKEIEDFVKNKITSLEGLEEVEIHFSERPWLGTDLESFIASYERMRLTEKTGDQGMDKRNRRRVSAYAIVEIDPSHLTSLFTKFYFTDNVVYCDATDGGTKIILLVQGQDFDQIRKIMANEIRTQPGVIRVKLLNVMDIIKM